MNGNDTVKLDLDDLPVHIFEVTDLGLSTQTLTTGHGIPENGASFMCAIPGVCLSCSCMYPGDEEEEIEN